MNQLIRKNTEPLIYTPKTTHGITFLLFTANWCEACKEIDAMFDEQSKQFKKTAYFDKINIDDEKSDYITIQYKIVKIPTIIIIVEGKIKNYINEHITQDLFHEIIEKQLKKNSQETSISISQ